LHRVCLLQREYLLGGRPRRGDHPRLRGTRAIRSASARSSLLASSAMEGSSTSAKRRRMSDELSEWRENYAARRS
jgi:hypothetical protein